MARPVPCAAATQWLAYLVRHRSYLREQVGVKMSKRLGEDYYTVKDHGVYNGCCDSIQFKYLCITCGENAGCYFCDFDPDVRHDCE